MFTKTSLMRTGGALGATVALIGIGLSPAAAIHDGSATANASTLTGTGLFESIAPLLQQGDCTATFANGGPEAKVGECTPSIALEPAQAIVRFATANVAETGAATSAAESAVAEVPITDLATELNLTDILTDLAATSDSASALGPLLSAIGETAAAALAPLTTAIDGIVGPLLTQVQATLPLSIEIGAIVATCAADGTTATASSDVASVDILVDLSGLGVGTVVVPMTLATTANADLIADVGQLVDGIIDGLEATLTESTALSLLLTPVALLINDIQEQVVDALLAQLRPTLLVPLSNALSSILSVKLNVTPDVATGTAQPFTAPEEIDLTAIYVAVLGDNTLSIGHVHCGDNADGTVHTPGGPSETPDVPTVIDSGLAGGSFGGAGMVAAMMVVGAAVGVAGHRLTRSLS